MDALGTWACNRRACGAVLLSPQYGLSNPHMLTFRTFAQTLCHTYAISNVWLEITCSCLSLSALWLGGITCRLVFVWPFVMNIQSLVLCSMDPAIKPTTLDKQWTLQGVHCRSTCCCLSVAGGKFPLTFKAKWFSIGPTKMHVFVDFSA